MKVVDKHDVAVFLIHLGIQNPAAVGRDRNAPLEILVQFKHRADLIRRENKVAHRPGASGRNEGPSCIGRAERDVFPFWIKQL